MSNDQPIDYYEVMQISPNADPDMISRVYRLLAQRYHPDNQDTGNVTKFRLLTEAHGVLSDAERRAKYDLRHQQTRKERWRLVTTGLEAEDDFESERALRLTVLEVLYTRRRMEPSNPGIFPTDLEQLTGTPREHLEFTTWFLMQKKLVQKSDSSHLVITADGVDYLEHHYESQPKRLRLQGMTQERRAAGC